MVSEKNNSPYISMETISSSNMDLYFDDTKGANAINKSENPHIDLNGQTNQQVLPDQPQKLGSYRSRAGKLSNTLSNLLPSISAKLHHSKKLSNGKVVDGEVTVSQDLERKNDKNVAAAVNGIPTSELDNLVNFPDSSSFLMQNSRLPLTVSRTRNDTMHSQMTDLSMGTMGASSSAIWSTNPNLNPNSNPNPNDTMQHPVYQQYTSNGLNPSQSNMFPTNQNFSGVNSSNMPNIGRQNSNWSNNNNDNRQRSRSAATSNPYVDNTMYDQVRRQHTPSVYSNVQNTEVPLVSDDIDPISINWVSMDHSVPLVNQISNLLPTNTISISNIFSLQQQHSHLSNTLNLTSISLVTLCSKFGKVLSARTLEGINMALIEFESVESAIQATESLQGKEISMLGAPGTVAFAKILPMIMQQTQSFQMNTVSGDNKPQSLLHEQLLNGSLTIQQQGNISIPIFNPLSLGHQSGQIQPQSHQHQKQHQHQHTQSQLHHQNGSSVHVSTNEKEQCPFSLPPLSFKERKEFLKNIVESFTDSNDETKTNFIIRNALKNEGTTDTTSFGPLPDTHAAKDFDAPTLRELRKVIDANQMNDLEIEQLAIAMLDELPALSSDYLGNTIVQKLFECSSDIIKDIMLRKTAPYLTSMGVHKNGTWACQKIIKKAKTSRQMMLVAKGVEKYSTPLFNDQFGNYVIQCVLKFGFPWNNFIFENIVANFWLIAQNRYGSRAVRACLEAHDIVTKEQTMVLSAMIILYVEYLITNSNGTLLVTWFLDTCNLANRHQILAKQLVPHIVELSCNRLSSLTVLKILSYRGDEITRNIILDAIFGNIESEEPPKELQKILCDQNNGPTFVYKVLSMPLLEGDVRIHVIKQVRKLLTESAFAQHHRRLMEEVGLNQVVSTPSNTKNHQSSHTAHMSNGYAQDATRHVSHLSMSSVRSGSSRHGTVLQPVGSNISQNQSPAVFGGITNSTPGMQPLHQTNISTGFINHPGMYPTDLSGANVYPIVSDDLIPQFDSMSINNGMPMPLPTMSNAIPNSNYPILDQNGNHEHNDNDLNVNHGNVYGY